MEKEQVIELLTRLKAGRLSVNEAFRKLRCLPYEDLGFAKVDHHRAIRTGFPEVVFCQGKTKAQVLSIFRSLARNGRRVLLTRCDEETAAAVVAADRRAVYNRQARVVTLDLNKRGKKTGLVSVICAGTSDITVAEEAAVTAELFGSLVERHYDVGVAGLHRLLDRMDRLGKSRCIVAAAGMEGALASVIGGLVSCPVIAVPTSVGYGAGSGGITPLLTMLNSCAPGVGVVNIDNGFGAGYLAALINRGKDDHKVR